MLINLFAIGVRVRVGYPWIADPETDENIEAGRKPKLSAQSTQPEVLVAPPIYQLSVILARPGGKITFVERLWSTLKLFAAK